MTNTILSSAEVSFLRKAIVNKYCQIVNEDVTGFAERLTGSIKYYEVMAIVISEYLAIEQNLTRYFDYMGAGQLKIMLKKWLEASDKERNSLDRPAVSANTLRKLIKGGVYGSDLVFKDFFVLGCYVFIEKDRSEVLKELTLNEGERVKSKIETIPPTNYNNENKKQFTRDKKSKFMLRPYENGHPIENSIEFNFNEEPVALNRSNLDSSNNTITSKIQAKIYFKDGDWIIENFSDFNTTQLKILRPTVIMDGDVIIFGNKFFLFEG